MARIYRPAVRRIGRHLRVASVVAFGVAVALVATASAPSPAQADAVFQYFHHDSECSSLDTYRFDPVNVIFYNSDVLSSALADEHFAHHLTNFTYHGQFPWGGENQQYSWDVNGNCRETEITRADQAPAYAFRYHVRMLNFGWAQGEPPDNFGQGNHVHAGAHEEAYSCPDPIPGHAIESPDGFNSGRTRVENGFGTAAADHPARAVNWGNTRPAKQCNDEWVSSDGGVLYIYIPPDVYLGDDPCLINPADPICGGVAGLGHGHGLLGKPG